VGHTDTEDLALAPQQQALVLLVVAGSGPPVACQVVV
jgi:hypothetical protein